MNRPNTVPHEHQQQPQQLFILHSPSLAAKNASAALAKEAYSPVRLPMQMSAAHLHPHYPLLDEQTKPQQQVASIPVRMASGASGVASVLNQSRSRKPFDFGDVDLEQEASSPPPPQPLGTIVSTGAAASSARSPCCSAKLAAMSQQCAANMSQNASQLEENNSFDDLDEVEVINLNQHRLVRSRHSAPDLASGGESDANGGNESQQQKHLDAHRQQSAASLQKASANISEEPYLRNAGEQKHSKE